MNKLEQAARQALEAMEEGLIDDKWYAAKDAMREALGENNGCTNNIGDEKRNSNNDRNSALVSNSSEALAEQRPEGFDYIEPSRFKAEQVEQEPVGVVEGSGEWGIAGVLVAGVPIGTKLYAAPVRTKDLTDDEIFNLNECESSADIAFARAVIAAYKEKNK